MSEKPTPLQENELFEWKCSKGALMFAKKNHELNDDERAMMKTPPVGWSWCSEKSDYVYSR